MFYPSYWGKLNTDDIYFWQEFWEISMSHTTERRAK